MELGLQRRRAAWLLAGVTLLALVLRFWKLGEWNLQATEIFTLRDSYSPQFRNPRPLGYLLNYYLVRPFIPLDEFGLRLLPALFGVAAVPAFYFATRRLIGSRGGLIGALLIAVSPLLIMYSQLARYWSLVFLLCLVAPLAIYSGFEQGSRRITAWGVAAALLAILAHPVSVLLLGGPLILLAIQIRREHLTRWWPQRTPRLVMIGLALVGVAVLVRMVPLLQSWIRQHDENPESGQFLLRPRPDPGIKQILNLANLAESLTFPLALLGVVGLYLLWRRDRRLASFLASLIAFPLLFLSLVSFRAPISQYYMLPVVPFFFVGSAFFIDRLFETEFRPRWLLPATMIALVIVAGAPTLFSDYRDGRRFDFRSVAHWLEGRLQPGDVVFSDQPMVLAHYLRGTPVQKLRRPTPLDTTMQHLQAGRRSGTLWLVAPAPSHAFRADLRQGGLIDWIYRNCQLRNTTGVGRVDLRQDYLNVYRCPPEATND